MLAHVITWPEPRLARQPTGSHGQVPDHQARVKPVATVTRKAERSTSPPIRRFASDEHKQLGDAASGRQLTDIVISEPGDYTEYLTFGEMVALAGDFFRSLDQIRRLAGSSEGRGELRWARWKALGIGAEPAVNDTVKKRVMDRYFELAAQNIPHFSAGGTAQSSYEDYHLQALALAFTAGVNNDEFKWEEALTTEAFGHHFLSDMFSAGHVRTERSAIKAWYDTHYPSSIDQFITYMAAHMLKFLKGEHGIANFFGLLPGQQDIEGQIRTIGGSALSGFTLGDIVSLACHNRDNLGLEVVSHSGVSQDGAAESTLGGFRFTAVGDSQLSRSPTTRNMAVAAMKESINDLTTMRSAGRAATGGRPIYSPGPVPDLAAAYTTALTSMQPYLALSFVPQVDTSAGNVEMNWHWESFNAEMRDAVNAAIRDEVVKVLREKASEQSDENVKKALLDFADHLNTQGIRAIERAIGVAAGP